MTNPARENRIDELCGGTEPQSQFPEFSEALKVLGRLQRAVTSGVPTRDDVIKLRALFEAQHVMLEIFDEAEHRSTDDLFIVAVIRTELPIVFYAFCRRLGIDANVTETECEADEVEDYLNSPVANDVWRRLQAAAIASPSPVSVEKQVSVQVSKTQVSGVTEPDFPENRQKTPRREFNSLCEILKELWFRKMMNSGSFQDIPLETFLKQWFTQKNIAKRWKKDGKPMSAESFRQRFFKPENLHHWKPEYEQMKNSKPSNG